MFGTAMIEMLSTLTLPGLAYVDPGTGSFLIQMLAGTVLGGLLALKMFWRRIQTRMAGVLGRAQPGRRE